MSARIEIDAESRRIIMASSGSSNVSRGTDLCYYDAAKTGRDADWGFTRTTVLEDFHFSGPTRRTALARIRRETENNPYLKGLCEKYPEAVGCSSLRSRTLDPAYNQQKEAFWHRWACEPVYDGRSLRTLEDLVKLEMLKAGELFIVKLASGLVQLVASEFCGSPWGATRFGAREINGVVRDAGGRPLAYRFGRLTQWGAVQILGTEDELVPADQVIHVFDSKNVIMGRGIPILLASIKTARDLYEITAAKTKQIKDVTSITGAVLKRGAENWLATNASADLNAPADATGETTSETVDSPADRVTTDKRPLKIQLAPGTFIFLEPGEQLQQLVNEYKAEDYEQLVLLMLHAIATPVGLPVELWFSGLGDVAYSGFKGLGTQWRGRRIKICEFLEEAFLRPLHDWRLGLAHELGELPPAPATPQTARPLTATLYQPTQDELIEWGWKRSAVLDDEKAAKANQIRLESGEADLSEIWSESGKFPEEVLAERRQLWINMLIASGELEAGADTSAVRVPREFLLWGKLPGMLTGSPANNPATDPEAPGDNADDAETPGDKGREAA